MYCTKVMERIITLVALCVLSVHVRPSETGQQRVTLSSTLICGNLALPQQSIVFTCTTRNSTILEWQSNEYIGTDGDNIQIYSVGSRDNVTSFSNPNTYAIRVSVIVENGITEIESQLIIIASDRFPTSSVTCQVNSYGPRQTISFNTTARALQEVTLNSTLIRGHLALPGQEVVFTCVVRNSTILEWQSNEHIGTDGDDIQRYSIGSRNNVTSVTIPTTYATRVSVTMENGITEIVSQLFITASDCFPTSSVTCEINTLGPRQTISFNTTARALQEVKLNSTLIGGNFAYSQQRVVFTCITRNTTFMTWHSDEYIGSHGEFIQIFGVEFMGIGTTYIIQYNPNTYATRVNVTVENGVTVIVSQLIITASDRFPTSSVTCRVNGYGPRQTISFNTTDEEPPVPKLSSTLHKVLSACPGETHQFKCEALYSHNMEWTSNEYIGSCLQINASSLPVGMRLKAPGNANTYVMLEREGLENGTLQLTSSLNITILESIRNETHTVRCLNTDLGTEQAITFGMAETCEGTITSISTTSVAVDGNRGITITNAVIICGIMVIIVIGIIIFIIKLCTKKADNCEVLPQFAQCGDLTRLLRARSTS